MQNIILSNAFSLQMLNLDKQSNIQIQPITSQEVQQILQQGFISAVGHQDTANVLSNILGVPVSANRININFRKDTILIVAQLTGGRLPEGAVALPDGFSFKFVKVIL